MEYYVGQERRRLVVEWNGSDVDLVKTTLIRHNSRSMQYKIQLYLPRMPNNHALCMKRRLRRSWEASCGLGASSARKIGSVIRKLHVGNGLHVHDDILVPLLEELALDDVAIDIDLIGYHQSGPVGRRRVCFLFGFYPDNIAHYLNNAVFGRDSINYGRNGDLSI